MLHHVVCMRFSEGVTPEQVQDIHAGLAALRDTVPEIRRLELGSDIVKSERSYDFALVVVFDDLEGMKRYQVHPEHQAVLAKIKAAAAQVVAVDFEV